MSASIHEKNEIHDRIRKGYLNRLEQRVRKIRRLLAERNWEELRRECSQLKTSSKSFGFPDLSALSLSVEKEIPEGHVSRARNYPKARAATEALLAQSDHILFSQKLATPPNFTYNLDL